MTDLCANDALTLAGMLRRREVSAREVTTAHIDRIEALDGPVNAVAPGWMAGDWMQARLGENYGRLMERRARMTPLGRCVTAEDVAATIVSLVTSNPFVTGEVVVVDGGYSATT